MFLKSLLLISFLFLSGCTVNLSKMTNTTDVTEIEYICGLGTVIVNDKVVPRILVDAEDEETSEELSKALKKSYYECLSKYSK
jgi:hypothetical protein